MMKTWLMRRPVRSPVSRWSTAASSSSEWRLPFISSSALPLRTSSTAFSAAAWLWATSTISNPSDDQIEALTQRPDLVLGAHEMGTIMPARRPRGRLQRSLVARMGDGSGKGGNCFAAAISRSYLSC